MIPIESTQILSRKNHKYIIVKVVLYALSNLGISLGVDIRLVVFRIGCLDKSLGAFRYSKFELEGLLSARSSCTVHRLELNTHHATVWGYLVDVIAIRCIALRVVRCWQFLSCGDLFLHRVGIWFAITQFRPKFYYQHKSLHSNRESCHGEVDAPFTVYY
jgi:hypothetical protein